MSINLKLCKYIVMTMVHNPRVLCVARSLTTVPTIPDSF